MTASHPGTGDAFGVPAGPPAGPPPPPPPSVAMAAAPAASPTPAAVTRPVPRPVNQAPSTPQDPYFVKSTSARPVFEPVVAQPPRREDAWLKPVLTVIALVVGALGGLWAVRALRSDDPVLNLGADGKVSMIEADSVFVPLRGGYQYKMAPAGVEEQMSQVVSTVPEAQGKLLGFGVRGIARGNQVVGAAVAAAVTPETIEDRGERRSAFDGIEDMGGSEPEKVELGGLVAYTTEFPTGNPVIPKAQAVVYFYENLVVMVFGFDETTAEDIATNLIEAGP